MEFRRVLFRAAPGRLPMVAWLPTRRRWISGFLWIATFGTHGRAAMDSLIDRYVDANTADIRKRLLPAALKVLHRHRRRGDRVLVATGAPPELARPHLAFVAHEGLPVIGSLGKPFLGGLITDQPFHTPHKH